MYLGCSFGGWNRIISMVSSNPNHSRMMALKMAGSRPRWAAVALAKLRKGAFLELVLQAVLSYWPVSGRLVATCLSFIQGWMDWDYFLPPWSVCPGVGMVFLNLVATPTQLQSLPPHSYCKILTLSFLETRAGPTPLSRAWQWSTKSCVGCWIIWVKGSHSALTWA